MASHQRNQYRTFSKVLKNAILERLILTDTEKIIFNYLVDTDLEINKIYGKLELEPTYLSPRQSKRIYDKLSKQIDNAFLQLAESGANQYYK